MTKLILNLSGYYYSIYIHSNSALLIFGACSLLLLTTLNGYHGLPSTWKPSKVILFWRAFRCESGKENRNMLDSSIHSSTIKLIWYSQSVSWRSLGARSAITRYHLKFILRSFDAAKIQWGRTLWSTLWNEIWYPLLIEQPL